MPGRVRIGGRRLEGYLLEKPPGCQGGELELISLKWDIIQGRVCHFALILSGRGRILLGLHFERAVVQLDYDM